MPNLLSQIDVHSENKIRIADQLIVQKELYNQQRQIAGKENLFIFNKHILGIEKGKSAVKLSPFHKELCNFITDDMNRKKLVLVPRGHLKSSLITIGYSLFRIINNPNIRILLLNATWQMAVDFLTEIKRHLRENEDLIKLYGDLSEGAEEWSSDRITLKRTDHNIKGPTVWATGIESNLVGSHPDLIILDDVVNRDNSETSEQITKVTDRYRDTLDLLEPGGQLIVIGCLTADSLVLMGDGTWKNINKIKVGEEVFSYKDKKIVKRRVEAMIPQGKSKVYRIKTIRHDIKATDRHPFLTTDGKWKKVRDLKKGDKIITIAQAPTETSKRFYNGEFLRKGDFFLLGYLWGDGWLLKDKTRGIRGFCVAKGIHDSFIPNLEKWTKNYKEKKEGYYRIENKKIGEWLYENGFDSGARTKRIPKWIFQTRTSYRKAFIDGILEADGSRVSEGRRIELANKGLIEDLYWLSQTSGYRPTSIFHRQRFIQAPHSKEATLHDFYSLGLTKNHRQAFGENQFNWRWDRIESVDEAGEEEVFDLTIEETANFISNGYVVHNTRWTPVDLYGWILDPENNVKDDFDIMIKEAYGGNLETGEGFIPLWPEKFDLKELQSRLRGDGWYQFSAQYMNNPIPEQDAKFKRDNFQLFDVEEIRGKEMRKVLTIDPAISLEKHADFTAMTVCGIDQFSNIFLLDIWRGKVLPSELISKIFELNELWHPNHIGIETNVFQKTLAYSLREEMQRRGRFLPLTEVQPHERTKELRIQGLQPLYENRKVFHPRNHPLKFYFEQELVEFPRGGHDDMIDAFSYALDFLHPIRPKKNRYHRQWLY